MALRSPNTFHNYWGIVASANALPNAPGSVVTVAPLNLQAGDIAFVSGESTLYLCTNPGTVNNGGDAVWAPLYSGVDHFAPKYVVGSSDDSQIPFNVAGFYYFPDDGTGNGIKAAFEFINFSAGPAGDIYIRPGFYDLTQLAAAGDLPFLIPGGCKVQGAGDATSLVALITPGGVAEIFTLQEGSHLSDLKIEIIDDAASSVGRSVISTIGIDRSYCTRLKISVFQNYDGSTLDTCIMQASSGALYLDTCYLLFQYSGDFNNNPEYGGRAGVRAPSDATVYRCNISAKDFGIACTSPTAYRLLVDQSVVFGAVGIYSTGHVNVVGNAEITSSAGANVSYGIQVDQVFDLTNTISVIGARVIVDPANPASIGIKSNAYTGQVVGSNIIAPVGIDTSGSVSGHGHALGFNVIQATPGSEINSALMDEVAHNIFV